MDDNMQTGAKRLRRTAAAALLVLALAACTPIYRDHGFVPTDDELDAVIVGVDTAESVAGTLGRPAAVGVMENSGYYYVANRFRHYGWRAPREVSREVVAVRFDDDGVVSNVERFGLRDGEVVALSRRVTETNVRGVTFIRQLIGNIGNLRADQFTN